MRTIGERLQAERERLRLSQEKMAALGGVTRRSQSNYENGSRSPDAKYLAGVAEAGVDIEYVLSATPEHQRPKRVLLEPSKDNPALHTVREVEVTYKTDKSDERILDDMESFVSDSRAALEDVEKVLKKIGFEAAHSMIKNTLAHLLQFKQITIGGAEAVLVLMRDDLEFHNELLEKERKKNESKS